MKWFDYTALTLVIIGAVKSWLSRIIYTLVGLCGLYLISLYGRITSAS